MKIAIVGAGFFGLTLGLILSKRHEVEIFEKKKSKTTCLYSYFHISWNFRFFKYF